MREFLASCHRSFKDARTLYKTTLYHCCNRYGVKDEATGEWSGLIGDLAKGETDIVVADLTMTSEREEVIDFVSPYFDQVSFYQGY